MQLSNIYDVSKTKLHGKMNSINTPIFKVFYVKTVWGHARARAHRSRGHHYKTGERKRKRNKGGKGGRGAGEGEGEKLTK